MGEREREREGGRCLIFGLVTKRELEKAIADAREDNVRALQEMQFEWSRWYDKFRQLYAQWVKRDKKAAEDEPGGSAGELGPESVQPAGDRRLRFPNSRRGF